VSSIETLPRGVSPATRTASAAVPAIVARGKRIYLRTLVPEDLRWLARWAQDPFVERMVGSDLLYVYRNVYDLDSSFYEACLTDPTQIVLVVMANHGWAEPVGMVRLFNIHLLEGYAFLETIIADQKAIRRGFGVEAGKLISYYGVDVLGLRRLEAKVYEYNVLSMNSLKRHGFQQEGVLRKAGYQDGRYWNVVVFGILKEEIEEQRNKDGIVFPFDPIEGDGRDSP
jgi:RimJ/RimL family protein N-acetyltransferase